LLDYRLVNVLRLTTLAVIAALVPVTAGSTPAQGSQATMRFAIRSSSDSTLSTNWAGYAVRAGDPAVATTTSFSDVTGTWVQPKVRCLPGEVGAAAFWVGLGGWDQSSRALEQIGTEADCNEQGLVTYSGWYELVPAGPVTLKLRIHPRDRVTAAVVASGSQVVFSLKNLTRHTRFSKRLTPNFQVDTGSAEWIAEAPSLCQTNGRCTVVPLTNFGTMKFSGAATIGNGHPGTISDATWSPSQVVLAPDPGAQTRYGVVANTHGAVPSATSPDGRAFSVSWRRTTSVQGG